MLEMSEEVSSRGTMSLESLVALNDEIAALVRTGLPLERGLRQVGDDLSGRLGGTMSSLAERMSRGASLPEALAAEGDRLPRIYRAVVEAGLRAGRLSAALEKFKTFMTPPLRSFTVRSANEVLKVAASEYEAAIEDGRIVERRRTTLPRMPPTPSMS